VRGAFSEERVRALRGSIEGMLDRAARAEDGGGEGPKVSTTAPRWKPRSDWNGDDPCSAEDVLATAGGAGPQVAWINKEKRLHDRMGDYLTDPAKVSLISSSSA
jgi:hypothetical protein